MTKPQPDALEQHFTADQIAQKWHLDSSTVRKIFQDEPGVLKISEASKRGKRGYVSLRIPESVVKKVHESRSR